MMKTIYFECNMGASGDMLMAALLELCDDRQNFLDKLNSAGIPGVAVTTEPSVKCGIVGTRVKVLIDGREEGSHYSQDVNRRYEYGVNDTHRHDHDHDHDHHHHNDHSHNHEHNHQHDKKHDDEKTIPHSHNNYHDIERLVENLKISHTVKTNVLAVYKLIAEAESSAHGLPVDKIHFHEVGEMDAVADITGVCMLLEELSPDMIIASPVNVGGGHVRCAHGVLPVPAPATAHILRGVPIYGIPQVGELCTPTGAAILRHFAKRFSAMPVMTIDKIGYGMGKRNLKQANCVRAYVGNAANAENVIELICNLDDMPPESVSFAQETLLQEGALDAWTTPIVMKKGRLGVMFSCLCREDDKDKMVAQIFKHTSTLGIRENTLNRYTLHRERYEVQTPYGAVHLKTAQGFGVTKSKPEYEDIAKIARENGVPMDKVSGAVLK